MLVKRFGKKGKRVRRSGPLSRKQVKAVARVANRVCNKKIETKSAIYSTTFKAYNGITTSGIVYNLIEELNGSAGLPQGTAEARRIGDKIQARGLKLRLCFANHPYDGNQPYQVYSGKYSVRVVIFGTRTAVPTRATLFRADAFPLIQNPDTDENRIIYDRVHNFSTTLNYGVVTDISYWAHKLVNIWIPGHKLGYKGNLQFQDDSSTSLKGFSYYMGLFAALPHDSGNSVASVMWNGVFYFKDA